MSNLFEGMIIKYVNESFTYESFPNCETIKPIDKVK